MSQRQNTKTFCRNESKKIINPYTPNEPPRLRKPFFYSGSNIPINTRRSIESLIKINTCCINES
jgi:hypothetical protein